MKDFIVECPLIFIINDFLIVLIKFNFVLSFSGCHKTDAIAARLWRICRLQTVSKQAHQSQASRRLINFASNLCEGTVWPD
jgi:hypothetical protein